jgi:C-methyltransferase C-terminal domain/Methyltransferase domain/Putative zinc binding domain
MTHYPEVYLRKTCRVCRANFVEVLNLGNLRLNAFPTDLGEVQKTPRVQVILCVCPGCGLAQLDRTVPPDWMYRTYWYRSSVNEMMRRELQSVVQAVQRRVPLTPADWVLDIGANDGTLLDFYKGWGERQDQQPRRTAVEPANNLQELLKIHAEEVIHDYFPSQYVRRHRAYKVVTAIAMCYDLEDPRGFFTAIANVLHPDGLCVVQFQDFGQQLLYSAFDNICHEHLEYYTLHSLLTIIRQAGLMVVDVETRTINGGSLRVYLQHVRAGRPVSPAVDVQLVKESTLGLSTDRLQRGKFDAFQTFARRVQAVKEQIAATLGAAVQEARVVDVLGASTKGNFLLQALGIGPAQIRQAIDRDPHKTGRLTITGIPIVGEERAKVEPADLWLAPIWQFRDSVIEREGWYLQQGGRIIFPLPYVDIVAESWGARQEEEVGQHG